MQISKPIEFSTVPEVKILKDVRLIHRHDLNPIYSKENLRVQFEVNGEIRGNITCFLCLDRKELDPLDKNYIFPLFVESMNILIGKQISLDKVLSQFKIKLSSPKSSMKSKEFNTIFKSATQKYELELAHDSYQILTEYNLEALN